MNDLVYIVSFGFDCIICGVFSTKKNAEEYIGASPWDKDGFVISPCLVDIPEIKVENML